MKTTTIDASLLPKAWLFWSTTKGNHYLNCATGEKQTLTPTCLVGPNRDVINNTCINSGSKPRFAYAKYHEDIECLELAEVTVDTTRKAEPHPWKYAGNKYFLRKDKVVFNENGEVVTSSFNLSQYHVARDFKGFLSFYYRLRGVSLPVNEFKKFLGANFYTVGSGRTVPVMYAWHIREWYVTKQKVKGPGREQKKVDKLTSMPVSDLPHLVKTYPIYTKPVNRYYSRDITGIMYFERLTDGWSVLRMFNRNRTDPTPKEHERVYLHDNGDSRITSLSENGWIPARLSNDYWTRYCLVNRDEAMEKCKRLKYIVPLFDATPDCDIHKCLTNAIRFPEIEQLMRLDYQDIAMRVATSNTPRAEMKQCFSYYNEKERNLIRKVGLNKYQFNKFASELNDRYYNYACRALEVMREVFGDSLVHLDNATFDRTFAAMKAICSTTWGKPFKNIDNLHDIDRSRFIKNAIRLGEKHGNVYTVLNDTINQYVGLALDTRPEINWYFDSYSDVIRAHDAIDELKRAQDAERRAMWDKREAERLKREEAKRVEIDKKRKEYEYEDDNFIIRLPENGNEIVREGRMQRICIGGYVSRHATGGTNLFFLRKKSEPKTPFYAIEMNNSKQIVQIHGFCNKWLGNNPEAIPTVVRWLRKNGISCNEKILTCASTGYGATNNYVKMPVVD